MKLELKHLAPYLPYGLKAKHSNSKYDDVAYQLALDSLKTTNKVYLSISSFLRQDYKPILRPLSDLTEEIDKIRKEFQPTSEYKNGSSSLTQTLVFEDDEFKIKVEDCYYTSDNVNIYYEQVNDFEIYQKLIEMHFDIFGLIEKGLAIDINTLKP